MSQLRYNEPDYRALFHEIASREGISVPEGPVSHESTYFFLYYALVTAMEGHDQAYGLAVDMLYRLSAGPDANLTEIVGQLDLITQIKNLPVLLAPSTIEDRVLNQ